MKFTDRSIRSLKPRPQRYEAFEDNGKGFAIRISPKSRKTWIFLYRFNKRPRRMSFGTYPSVSLAMAHKRHAKAMAQLEQGIDPGAVKQQESARARTAPTIPDLANEYMEFHAKKKKRSWREDQRMLDVYVLPKWKKLKVGEIKRRGLVLLLDDIDAPVQANRVLALVRKMFNFAVDRGILEATPFTRMKLPHEEKERGRTLTPDEIKAFWNGLDKSNIEKRTRLALKFLLVTAQRSIEVSDAARSEIGLRGRIWTIPASRTKNGYEHRLPLPDLAVELLGEAYALGGDSVYVFPDKKNGTKSMNEGTLRQAVSRNLAVFGIPQFTPHDLRRTASTMMRALIPGKGVDKVLNHIPPKLERTYDRHDYMPEKRLALEKWAAKLQSILPQRKARW
ncbi:MAG: tyrosine-type recombinase/integrase [Gammaproteobacteria bacterium]|nr:tyrosine-type recombinase/integrase [Gammaproteobacteria bacterium]